MKRYLVTITEAQLAQMQMSDNRGYEIFKKLIETQENDTNDIKAIRKAIKKIEDDATLVKIVSYVNFSRPKVVRILDTYDGLEWLSEPSFGNVGKPTKKYTRIKKVKG